MVDDSSPKDVSRGEASPETQAKAERAARLAAALRANLRRRKAPRSGSDGDSGAET